MEGLVWIVLEIALVIALWGWVISRKEIYDNTQNGEK